MLGFDLVGCNRNLILPDAHLVLFLHLYYDTYSSKSQYLLQTLAQWMCTGSTVWKAAVLAVQVEVEVTAAANGQGHFLLILFFI